MNKSFEDFACLFQSKGVFPNRLWEFKKFLEIKKLHSITNLTARSEKLAFHELPEQFCCQLSQRLVQTNNQANSCIPQETLLKTCAK